MLASPIIGRGSLQEHKDDMARVIVEMPPRDRSTGRLEGWTDRGTTGDDIACARVRGSWLARRRQASRLLVMFASQFRVLWYCLKQTQLATVTEVLPSWPAALGPVLNSQHGPAKRDLRPATTRDLPFPICPLLILMGKASERNPTMRPVG